MAKVVISDDELQSIGSYYPIIKIIVIGILSGLMLCLLAWAISQFIIEPLFCQTTINSTTCINSDSISGNIAIILVAFIGVIAMIQLRLAQPLIVATAVAVSLWGLLSWTSGLAVFEVIMWSILLFTLSYVLFTWLTRNRRLWTTLIIIIAIVLMVRIVLIL